MAVTRKASLRWVVQLCVPGKASGTSCTGSLIAPLGSYGRPLHQGVIQRTPRDAPPSDTYHLHFYIGNNANDKEVVAVFPQPILFTRTTMSPAEIVE